MSVVLPFDLGPTKNWIQAARPRTLPAALVPVAVGVAVASCSGKVSWWRGGLALVVGLSMQVGTNYANDYSDGIRGTDDVRVGPTRLVASKVASPRAVRTAAIATFGIAAIAGLVLALATSLWLVVVGAGCIAAGWLYTGGPLPYGYAGFGELFVFVFFGLVAVTGTAYVSSGHFLGLAVFAAIPVGLLSVALLVVNNLRDIKSDASVGKRTLAVALGDRRTRLLYAACIVVAGLGVVPVALQRPFAAFGLFVALPAVIPIRRVLAGETGRDLIAVLGLTGALQILFGALFVFGIAL